MRTHDAPFLEAIAADPDSDAPRLIYADWLEEQGDARAEFIRAQCERERLPWHEARWWQLYDREQELLARHGKAWIGAAPRLRNIAWGVSEQTLYSSSLFTRPRLFVRGMLEVARTRNLQALLKAAPAPGASLLREAQFKEFGPRLMGQLRASGWLQRLRGISLCHKWLGRDFLEPLGNAPEAAGLRRLDLADNLVQRSGLEALCASPYLASLEHLNLAQNRLEQADVRLLLEWPAFTRLKSLCLFGNMLGSAVAELLASPAIAHLHWLDAGACYGGRLVGEALEACPPLPQLVYLSLSDTQLTSARTARVLQRGLFPNLRVLRLANCGVGDSTLEALAASSASSQLRLLTLGDRREPSSLITRQGLAALAASPHLGNLRMLVVRGTPIDDEAATAFAQSPHLARLREIGVDGPLLSTAAQERLARRYSLRLGPAAFD